MQRQPTQPNGEFPREIVTKRSLVEGSHWQKTVQADGSVVIASRTSYPETQVATTTVAADETAPPAVVSEQTYRNGLLMAQKSGAAAPSVTFSYNGFGQMTQQIHPGQGTSNWGYVGTTGQLDTQTAAGSSAVSYAYYPAGHVNAGQVASVTANGEVTRYAYDAQGRQTHQWGTGAQPLRYEYDSLGRLWKLHTYAAGADWAGAGDTQPASFTSGSTALKEIVTTWEYKPRSYALWKKLFSYDAFAKTEYTYNAAGLLIRKVGANTEQAEYAYETVSANAVPQRLKSITYSGGNPTANVSITYRRSGEVYTITDAAGVHTFSGGSGTGSRTETISGDGLLSGLQVHRDELDGNHPLTVSARIGSTQVALQQYEWTADRQLDKAYQGVRGNGAGGPGLQYVWGRNPATGRVDTVTTAALTGASATHGVRRSYGYTAGGRIDNLYYNSAPVGAAGVGTSLHGFRYWHDQHGRRERVEPYLPDSATPPALLPPGWKYGYNAHGGVETADRFTPAGGPETGVIPHQRRGYEYDLMGDREIFSLGTGTEAITDQYTWNHPQILTIQHDRCLEITGQAVPEATVQVALNGGPLTPVDRTDIQNQTGDPASFRRVATVQGSASTWYKVQVSAGSGSDSVVKNGFVAVPPETETLHLDSLGRSGKVNGWECKWDGENRLVEVEEALLDTELPQADRPPRRKIVYAYDYMNRRIAKTVWVESYNILQPGWRIEKDLRFVYDGYQMIAELDHTFATGTGLEGSRVNRTFLWGPDVSGTMTGAGGVGGLLSTTYQGVTYHVCSDANGNVTGLVPGSGPQAGTLIARYDYDPFGKRITNTGPDVDLCPFGFSTKYTDSETGIVHYDLREYSPQLGRWLSRDPIGERGGVNLYGFVGNDPVNRIDYLGLDEVLPNCCCINRVDAILDGKFEGSKGMRDYYPNRQDRGGANGEYWGRTGDDTAGPFNQPSYSGVKVQLVGRTSGDGTKCKFEQWVWVDLEKVDGQSRRPHGENHEDFEGRNVDSDPLRQMNNGQPSWADAPAVPNLPNTAIKKYFTTCVSSGGEGASKCANKKCCVKWYVEVSVSASGAPSKPVVKEVKKWCE